MNKVSANIGEKEHADFVETTGESKENLDSMNAAIAALEKGMGKAFLQSQSKAARVMKVPHWRA